MGQFLWPDWKPLPVSDPDANAAPPPPADPEQAIADNTRAEEALNQFIAARQAALFEAPDAFYRTQGSDAIHAAPAVTQALQQVRFNLLEGLANDSQRNKLASVLDGQMRLTRDGIARHVAEQSLAWQRKTAQDRIALLTKEAAYHHNDNELVDALGHAAANAARAHARVGDAPLDPQAEDAAAAFARSGVLGAAIQARLDRGDTASANALFTQVQNQLNAQHAASQQGQLADAKMNASGIALDSPVPPMVPVSGYANDSEILSDASPEPIIDGQQYAQAGGRPPERRSGPGARDLTVREEIRQDFFEQHRSELEKLEPSNPKLSYVAPRGWVPSQRNVDEMVREVINARARVAARSQQESSPGSPGSTSSISASDLVRGSVPNGIHSRTAEAELEARPKLSRSEQMVVNSRAGREYEQTIRSDLENEDIHIGSQLTLETPSGKRIRLDFVTRDPVSGKTRCIECKASETAPLRARQREAFPEIGTSGATVRGRGKPEFPGGTVLPPTNVEIIRKR